jgi:uncharacterized protein (TIGR03437 family)
MRPFDTVTRRTSLLTLAAALALGAASGYFTPGGSLSTVRAQSAPPPAAGDLPVGDFNGDGKLDYAYVSTPHTDDVEMRNCALAVRLGNGDGTFSAPVKHDVGSTSKSVRKGDFNGDGKLDLVITHNGYPATETTPGRWGTTASIFIGRGDGTFEPKRDIRLNEDANGHSRPLVADLNNDGKADIVVVEIGSVYVLLGNGLGAFSTQPRLFGDGRGSIGDVAVADLNQDGKLDLLAANGERGVSVWPGRGDGTFAALKLHLTARTAVGVAAGDLNGDGRPDIVAMHSDAASVSVLYNQGDGTFGGRREYASPYRHSGPLRLADLNGDGRLDVLMSGSIVINDRNESRRLTAVLPGQCHGELGAMIEIVGEEPIYEGLYLADFNRDGKTDLLVRPEPNYLLLHPNASVGGAAGDCPPGAPAPAVTFAERDAVEVPRPAKIVKGDFNSDGKLDLAAVSPEDPKGISLHFGRGDGTFTPWSFSNRIQTNYARDLLAADVNNDGKLDLLNGQVWLGGGDGKFTLKDIYPYDADLYRDLADFNGDGKLDLVSVTAVRLGGGDGTFGDEIKTPFGTGLAVFPAVGDFNSDGKLDLVRVSYETGQYTLLVGRGDGSLAPHRESAGLPVGEPTGGRRPAGAKAGDLNGDGKLDLVVTHGDTSIISTFIGNGDGTFTRRMMFPDTAAQLGLNDLADFNGDGKLDLVGTTHSHHLIVLPGLGDGTFGVNTIIETLPNPGWPTPGDFNQDGKVDLALTVNNYCYQCTSRIAVYLNTSTGAPVAPNPRPTPTPAPTPTPTPAFFVITGKIADSLGRGVSGATVTLSGARTATMRTIQSGQYIFRNLPSGQNYTVTVTDAAGAWVFTPPSKTFTNLGNNEQFNFAAQPANTAVTVSAASYTQHAVAAESIVSVFGSKLSTETAVATGLPLPTSLGGTRVKVIDRAGFENDASLFFVSPTQINCLVPEAVQAGAASIKVISGDGTTTFSQIEVSTLAPGVFSADATGGGLAAAGVTRVRADGSRADEPIARFDQVLGRLMPIPIDLGPEGEEVYLILFGTGWRFRSDLANVSAQIGGQRVAVYYAGMQPSFAGLDQANILIPRALRGAGEVDVVLTVDGKVTNRVKVKIK